jgi:hypothetical protein
VRYLEPLELPRELFIARSICPTCSGEILGASGAPKGIVHCQEYLHYMLRLDTWNLWSSQGNCSLPGVSALHAQVRHLESLELPRELFIARSICTTCSGEILGTSGAPKGIVHCQEYLHYMLRLDTWNLWGSQGNCALPGVSALHAQVRHLESLGLPRELCIARSIFTTCSG